MTADKNKHRMINEIASIRQLHFPYVTFLLSSEVSAISNISSSHASTNLPNRSFLYNYF